MPRGFKSGFLLVLGFFVLFQTTLLAEHAFESGSNDISETSDPIGVDSFSSGYENFVSPLSQKLNQNKQWQLRTIINIEKNLGMPDTMEELSQVQSALEAMANGQDPRGPGAETARKWVEEVSKALPESGLAEDLSVSEEILNVNDIRERSGAAKAGLPAIEAPDSNRVTPPRIPSMDLKRAIENPSAYSYNSPEVKTMKPTYYYTTTPKEQEAMDPKFLSKKTAAQKKAMEARKSRSPYGLAQGNENDSEMTVDEGGEDYQDVSTGQTPMTQSGETVSAVNPLKKRLAGVLSGFVRKMTGASRENRNLGPSVSQHPLNGVKTTTQDDFLGKAGFGVLSSRRLAEVKKDQLDSGVRESQNFSGLSTRAYYLVLVLAWLGTLIFIAYLAIHFSFMKCLVPAAFLGRKKESEPKESHQENVKKSS